MPELASRAGGSPREPGLTVIHAAAGKRRRGVGVCVSVFGWGGGTFYFRKKSRRATPLFPPPLCAFFVLNFAFGSEGGHVLF